MNRKLSRLTGLLLLSTLTALAVPVLVTGCAHFKSTAQKSIYGGSQLADGAMKAYAVYWKDATNRLGDTPQLEQERSNVMVISYKVGVSLNTADQALQSFTANAGTNTATKDVVNALILTAVQQSGNLAAEVGVLTGNTKPTFSPLTLTHSP